MSLVTELSRISPDRLVSDLVVEQPDRSRVFEQLGIDYCCGGKQMLAAACKRAGVEVAQAVALLEAIDRDAGAEGEPNWSHASLSELARDIVERHHGYLRRELPRLGQMVDKVLAAHGEAHSELNVVREVFAGLVQELTMHMMKEEQVLFPMVVAMEEAAATGAGRPKFFCGSVENPIAVMEDEHQQAGDALARMRSLTKGYNPPADACPTYIALLRGLAQLEADLHLHIHKENNILFPRAAALERQFQQH
jgi:regulator of cell morphogenesis and NO signaling